MADITKCTGEGCPVKESCERFTAAAGERQSYFVEIPGGWEHTDDDVEGRWICEMFWGKQQSGIFESLKNIIK